VKGKNLVIQFRTGPAKNLSARLIQILRSTQDDKPTANVILNT